MKRPISIIIPLVICLAGCSAGIKLGNHNLTPRESTLEEEDLINEGIMAFDDGDYDTAIKLYNRVLAQNPENMNALYELCYTYFAKNDFDNCIELARRGTNYDSPILPLFYDLIGSCLDTQGQMKKAIGVFEEAVGLFPENYMLRFNMGVTYYNMSNIEKSEECFKAAVSLNPNHATSHLYLGNAYYDEQNIIPALLAYCRFLVLDPSSERSADPRDRIIEVINLGVRYDPADSNNITVYGFPDMPTSDGDYGTISVALYTVVANNIMDKSDSLDSEAKLINVFNETFKIMGELAENIEQSGFGWEYYVPYFAEMQKQGLVPAFVRYIFQIEGRDEGDDAIFLSWSDNYYSNQ